MTATEQPQFGTRLAELRRDRGLTQKQLAGDAVTASYVSLLEAGVRIPTLDVVVHLARRLEVPVSTLTGSVQDDALMFPADPAPAGVGGSANRAPGVLGRITRDSGDVAGAEEYFRAGLDAAESQGQDAQILDLGIELQDIYRQLDRPEEREQLLLRLLPTAERSGSDELTVKIHSDLAVCARDAGRAAEAVDHAERAAALVTRTPLAGTAEHVRILGVLISVLCEAERTSPVLGLVTEMMTMAELVGSPGVLGRAHWAAAMALVRIRRPADVAEHVMAASRALVAATTSIAEWARFARVAASTLLDVGASGEDTRRYLEQAEAAAAVAGVPAEIDLVRLLAARVALAAGDPVPAAELGEPASTLPIAGRVSWRATWGRGLLAIGSTSAGRAHLRSAAELAEQAQLFQHASDLWRQLAQADG